MQDDIETGSGSKKGDAEGHEMPEWDWLKEQAEEEKEERTARRRTEVRGTRLRPDEAEALDARAAAAGVTASTYIRLMCFGERPDLKAAQNIQHRLCSLVLRFADAHRDDPASAEEIQALRDAVEQICRDRIP